MVKVSFHGIILWGGTVLIVAAAFGVFQTTRGKDNVLTILSRAPVCSPRAAGAGDSERPFLTGNQRAMDRMMEGMATKPTGDVDEDFSAMMIPHHQGAIAMAVLELRYGHNEQLRRIAQEIIVDQQQEIAAMRFALGQSPPPSAPAPTRNDATRAPNSDAPTAAHSLKDMPK
jgi:hypothetical protein